MKARTTLVIASRLSTLKTADCILVVMDKWPAIVEILAATQDLLDQGAPIVMAQLHQMQLASTHEPAVSG